MGRIALAVLLTFAIAAPAACRRTDPATSERRAVAPDGSSGGAPFPAGTVGPLGADCYATTHATACPPDPSDRSGRKLPAHGGPCSLPACRPCGSETKLAFRDEKGVPMPGFCICVPTSDDSGRGVFSCYDIEAWKKRER